jgi:hypothetical protein
MSADTFETRKCLLALSLLKTRKNEKIIPPRFFRNAMKEDLPTIPYSTPFFRNSMKENLLTFSYSTSFSGNTMEKKCKPFHIPKYRYYKFFAKRGTLLGLKYI